MRTLLSGELTTALSYDADYFVKLEVQNGSGTWKDVSSYFDCIINAQWSEHVNDPVSKATFTIVRDLDGESFAPFMEGSSINVDDLSAYAPLFEQGRLIRAYLATMPSGTPLDTGKYREIFTGRIDSVRQTDVDGGATPIVLECSDLGAWLMDMQIEAGGTRYGEDAGVALEDVLQAILDDNIPAGEPSVTVVKESTSDFAVTAYDLGEGKVMEEQVKIVLDSVGEDFRYRHDSSHVSQLTWFNPDRARTSVDATITGYRLRKLDMSIANIRNAGELPYTDAETGVDGTVTAENSASIAKYRRRFQRMGASTLLTDETSAQATIDAVINDLSGAEADFEASGPLLWFVQLFDRYTFPADNKTYDTDQTFGIVGYQSTVESGRGETVMQCAGRIVGAYAEWLKRIPVKTTDKPLDVSVPPVLSYTVTTAGVLTAKVAGGEGTYVTRCKGRIDRPPTEGEVDAGTPSTAGVRTGSFSSLVTVKAGKRFHLAAKAYSSSGEGSVVARVSEVWLGIGSTAGADVIIGDIVAEEDRITYPIAFDDECAYCEVWTREFTTNPTTISSVENVTNNPYRVLTLGVDAMQPGIAFNLSLPVAGAEDYLMTTFVPFDHLGKRGNVQTKLTKAKSGPQDRIVDDPTDVTGLLIWLDAGQTAFSDGDPVDSWADQSGNAHDATQATGGNKPVYKDNVLNGLPVIEFDGVDDFLETDDAMVPTDGATMFVVLRRLGEPSAGKGFVGFAQSPTDTESIDSMLGEGTGGVFAWRKNQAGSTSNIGVYCSEWTTVCLNFQSTSSIVPYMDGTLYTSINPDDQIDTDGRNQLRLGAMNDGGTLYGAKCQIAEVILYDNAISADDRKGITSYLALKYETVLPPLDDPPDPPTAITQTGSTSSSIEITVTMPATAPEFIRVTVGGIVGGRIYDEPVTALGGADQVINIEGLGPGASYFIYVRSVQGGLVSTSLALPIGTTEASSGTLDAPTITGVTYNKGDQSFAVAITRGANNPLDTWYDLEWDDVPSNGFYTQDVAASIQYTTLVSDFPQVVGASKMRYFQVWARRAGWTNSARSAAVSGTAPGA